MITNQRRPELYSFWDKVTEDTLRYLIDYIRTLLMLKYALRIGLNDIAPGSGPVCAKALQRQLSKLHFCAAASIRVNSAKLDESRAIGGMEQGGREGEAEKNEQKNVCAYMRKHC